MAYFRRVSTVIHSAWAVALDRLPQLAPVAETNTDRAAPSRPVLHRVMPMSIWLLMVPVSLVINNVINARGVDLAPALSVRIRSSCGRSRTGNACITALLTATRSLAVQLTLDYRVCSTVRMVRSQTNRKYASRVMHSVNSIAPVLEVAQRHAAGVVGSTLRIVTVWKAVVKITIPTTSQKHAGSPMNRMKRTVKLKLQPKGEYKYMFMWMQTTFLAA